jgi:integrase/recombinase XerD
LENKLVRLRVTKNRKESILPITESLVCILEEYLSYRGGITDDYLFCAEDGGKLGNNSLTNAIRKYNHRRGVQKSSIHLFRHTFAYMAMNNEMDVLRIQRLLCHARLDTTQKYLRQFGFAELQKDYEKYNPLETMKNTSMAKKWSSKKKL